MCTDTWTGGASTEAWATAGNWSTGVPGFSDVACIGSGVTVRVSEGAQSVGSLQDEGTLVVAGGSLEVSEESTVSSVDSLSLTGGTLSLAGELDVASSLTSSGNATVSGAGRLVVQSSATGTLGASGCSLFTLSGATLLNEGTVTLGASGGVSGQLDMAEGAKLENAGTFYADSYPAGCVPGSNSASIQSNGGSPSVSNTGTFSADAGGVHAALVSVPFDNEGTVHVASGVLNPTGGGSSTEGTWTTASGTEVGFTTGSFSLTHDDASGAKLVLSGGTLSIATGTTTVDSLSLTGGTLSLSGELDASGSLASSGNATVSGAGRLVVQSGATGTLGASGCSLFTLSSATLLNEGTVTLGASGGVSGQLDMAEGARLENMGTFNVDSYPAGCVSGSNNASIQDNSGSPSVSNTGTLNVGAGSGHTAGVSVPFSNTGTVHVASGVLNPTGGGSSTEGTWTTAGGTEVGFTTGSFSLTHDDASGAKLVLSGGTLSIATGTTTVDLLSLMGGTLSVSGELDVASSLVSSGNVTVSGAGRLVVGPGATGSIGAGGCSLLTLSAATLFNEGTVTLGASGGVSGQLDMVEGAHLENAGTFNADSYPSGCVPGSNSASIQNNGGSPSVSNTGAFNGGAGSGHTALVSVPFNNNGVISAQSGTLQFSGGGVPEHAAVGSWGKESGTSLVLSAGTFLIGEEVDLSQVEVTGATVERMAAEGAPNGSLSSLPYAGGTVEVSGTGHSIGSGFTSATIEVTPSGAGEWASLCGPLTPGLGGEFGCAWNTLSGSYPDGHYQLRAQLSDAASPPASGATAAITVLVDNTVPSGSLTPPAYIGGSSTVTGTADDTGSGVGTWQLQITPAGTSEWGNACAAQSTPSSTDHYTCTPNTSGLTDGSYELRAIITDNAGNTYTTSAGETTLDGTAPSGSLGTVSESEYVKGTLSLEGTASDSGSGVATWTPQIAPAGTSSWASACSPQSTPISGSTYGCSLNTTGHTDGAYQLRALITDSAGNTHATTAQEVTFDNTPPSGSLDALGYYSTGVIEVKGSATDAASGLASWQLEIKPTSGGSWESACLTQSVPLEGSVYGCSVDTTLFADGSYHLRATLTDNTGNTSVTSSISTHVNNLGEGEGPPECTDTWTGGASTEAWATAGNWSAGVPGSSDIACIGSGMTVRVTTGAQSVASLQAEGTLVISGGSLDIAEESEASTVDSLSLAGGTLSLAGDLDVTSSLESSESSTVNGAGRLVVQSGATGSLGAGGCSLLTLSGVTLLNEGTVTLGASGGVAGQLDMLEGAKLENAGTFNADSYSSGCVPGSNSAAIQSNGGSPSFTNTGTFNAGAGSGHTVLVSVPFSNTGTVHVASGALNPTGGGSSTEGTWTTASGTTVSFTTGTYSLTHDNASGAKVALSGGTLTIATGTTTVESLLLSGGSLSLSGELDVTSSLVSSESSTVNGAGRLVVQSGATGSLGAGGCSLLTLNGATLVNEGTVTLGASGGVAGQLDMLEGAKLENAGTFNADSYSSGCVPGSNSAAIQSNSGSPSFTNTGTFNAGAGSGHTVLVSVPFSNTGTVHVASGALNPTGGGSSTEGTWTTASGTTVSFTTGTYSLTNDDASGADFALSGGTLSIATGTTSVDTLSLAGGTLSLAGDLDVTSSLVSSESSTINGAGRLVVQSGATGTLGASGCSLLTLNGATLRNEGTVTLGASGGVSGQLDMLEGAKLENAGTFNLDSYPSGCVPGSNSASIQNNGGSPTVSNTGTFNANVGSEYTASVSVPFNNDGTVTAQSGTLQFSGGGIPATVATGAWSTNEGTAIVLSSGTFLIGSSVDLSQVEVTGATVTREEGSGPPSGSLTPRSYAAGSSVSIAGSGESVGSGFAVASIEVTPASTSEWHSLCGPLTPASGAFGCSWNTTGGSYPDGSYHLRAQLSDSSSPANTAPTATITVLVDNTTPSGSLEAPSSALSGSSLITGTASDSGSGVATWQLQITPAAETAWANACPSQSTPITEGVYGCSLESTEYEDGAYKLRSVITDNAGNSHTTTPVEAEIHNAAGPTAPSNMVAPSISGESRVGHTLSAAHGSWSGTPTISYAYQWERCNEAGSSCVEVSEATSATYALTSSDLEHTLKVLVTATNSVGSEGATSAASAVITSASPPANTVAPFVLGRARAGQTLKAVNGSWSGALAISYSYQWESCDGSGAECADIEGAQAREYTLSPGDVGSTLRVLMIATNPDGTASAESDASAVVDEGLAEITAPAITGVTQEGETLSAEHGEWSGPAPITYDYQWERCDPRGEECAEITEATGATYTVESADVGQTLRVSITASDSAGTMQATTGPTVVIGQSVPTDVTPPTITGQPNAGEMLRANTGEWTGGDLHTSYQWESCDSSGAECAPIEGANTSEHGLGGGDIGTTVRVIVEMQNSAGSFAVASAPTQPVKQGQTLASTVAPTVTGVAEVGETLQADPGSWSGNGAISYGYQWERCDENGEECAKISGADGATYTPLSGDIDKALRIAVSASDSNGIGRSASAATQPIAAEGAPVLGEAPAISGSGEVGEELTAAAGSWTASPEASYSYAWQRCDEAGHGCTAIEGATSATYTPSSADIGSTLTVIVTATNTGGTSHALTAPSEPIHRSTLANVTQPTVTRISGNQPRFQASEGVWDATGTVTYAYQWLRCDSGGEGCQPISGASGSSYSPDVADIAGSTLRIAVTASTNSGTLTVESDPAPVEELSGSVWINGNATVASILTATVGVAPEAGVTFAYQWQRCNDEYASCTNVSGANSSTYTIAEGDLNASLKVLVAVTSGGETTNLASSGMYVGAPVRTSPVTIYHAGGTGLIGGVLLHASDENLVGTDPMTHEYQWKLCNSEEPSECEAIEGANEPSYLVNSENRGAVIKVTVSDMNSYGSDTSTSSPTEEVAGSAPIEASPPALSFFGGLELGNTISVSTGEWLGDAPITYTYQWERCNLAGASCTTIGGATAASRVLAGGDAEHTLRVAVTAANGEGSETVYVGGAEYPVSVGLGLPTNAAPPTITGNVYPGNLLTAHHGAWLNTPAGTNYEYEWEACVLGGYDQLSCTVYHTGSTVEPTLGQDGDVIRVRVTAENPSGLVGVAYSAVTAAITMQAPLNETLPSITGEALAGAVLQAHKGTWAVEANVPIYVYQWEQCNSGGGECTRIPGATGDQFKPTGSMAGSRLRVAVSTSTSGGTTTAESAATSTIAAATATSNTEAPSITGTPTDGEALSASTGTWSGSPEIEYAYQWRRCSSGGSECADIASANTAHHEAKRADVGHALRVTVTASNPAGSTSTTSAATEAITAAGTPTQLHAPSLPLFAEAAYGFPLTVIQGVWSGDAEISDQWQRCDQHNLDPETHEPTCADIEHATGLTYTPTIADIGYELRVHETATNEAGNTAADTEITSTQMSPASVEDAGASYTGLVAQDQTIVASAAVSTVPVLPTSAEYVFERKNTGGANTSLQAGASPKYTPTASDVGHAIEIIVHTAILRYDETHTVETVTDTLATPAVKAVLTARTNPSVSGVDTSGSVLTATHGSWATEAEATYAYQWQRCDADGTNCQPIEGASGETYEVATADVGATVRTVVTAEDSTHIGIAISEQTSEITSGSVIENSAGPTLSGIASEGETLTVSHGEWSGPESISYTYQWIICYPGTEPCGAIAGATSAEYTPTSGDVGATLQAEVTAISGQRTATATTTASSEVTAAPAPVNTTAPRVSVIGPATSEAILTTTGGAWEHVDPGAVPGALKYQWERCEPSGENCQEIGEAAAETYDASSADIGSRLRVQVTAESGSGETGAISNLTPVIQESHGSARGAIVYSHEESLYATNALGTEPHAILTCAALTLSEDEGHCTFMHPAISPNGQTVAVEERPKDDPANCPVTSTCPEADNATDAHVILMNYDGSEARTLSSEAGQPAWSPDGTSLMIVHTTETGGSATSQLELVNLGSPETPTPISLPAGTDSAQSPSFAADGTRIAYTARDETTHAWSIYLADPDGSQPTMLETPGVTDPDEPTVLLSGEEVLLSALSSEGAEASPKQRSIYVSKISEPEPTAITSGTADYSSPRLGANGSTVLATKRNPTEGSSELQAHAWVTNTSGTGGHEAAGPGGEASEVSTNSGSEYGAHSEGGPTAHAAGATYDALARQFDPILNVDMSDGFLPISVQWMLRLHVPGGNPDYPERCHSSSCPIAKFPLTPDSGTNEHINYPEGDNASHERLATDRAMWELIDPGYAQQSNAEVTNFIIHHPDPQAQNEHVYYLLAHRNGLLTLDYWYYYTYNYYQHNYNPLHGVSILGVGPPNSDCQSEGGCGEVGHDLHQGDWENVEVVLNHTRLGNYRHSPYRATDYFFSRHGNMVQVTPSEAKLFNGHVKVYAAHGDHANYPACNNKPGYPLAGGIPSLLNLRDHVCAEHEYFQAQLPGERRNGLWQIGSTERAPENLASLVDKHEFSCWAGLFGGQYGYDHFFAQFIHEAGKSYGTSPKAPLRQLDSALQLPQPVCSEPGLN
jgi:hypothetical protein